MSRTIIVTARVREISPIIDEIMLETCSDTTVALNGCDIDAQTVTIEVETPEVDYHEVLGILKEHIYEVMD